MVGPTEILTLLVVAAAASGATAPSTRTATASDHTSLAKHYLTSFNVGGTEKSTARSENDEPRISPVVPADAAPVITPVIVPDNSVTIRTANQKEPNPFDEDLPTIRPKAEELPLPRKLDVSSEETEDESEQPESLPAEEKQKTQKPTLLPWDTPQKPKKLVPLPGETKQKPEEQSPLPWETKQKPEEQSPLPWETKQKPEERIILPWETRQKPKEPKSPAEPPETLPKESQPKRPDRPTPRVDERAPVEVPEAPTEKPKPKRPDPGYEKPADIDSYPYPAEPQCDGCYTGNACRDPGSGCSLRYGLSPRGFQVGGWIDQGVTINTDSPGDRSNFPVGFNDRSNAYQMNQLYLWMEKAVDECGCNWDVGGRVDFLYGTDYFYTMARGLELERDGSQRWNPDTGARDTGQMYGLAMPQAYVEAYLPWGNGLTVKFGHFYTILGHEAVPAPDNFFYSHSYHLLYGEPRTHSGVLANYRTSDSLAIQAGVTNGWDNFDDLDSDVGFLAGLSWISRDDRLAVGLAMHSGRDQVDLATSPNRQTMYSVVFSYELTDRTTYVFQHDWGFADQGVDANTDANWYGINQYLLYDINPCWAAGLRFEWFRDEDGVRVANNGGVDYFEVTFGLNWMPNDRVVVRPEFRWDWVDTPGARPFIGGTHHDQVLFDFDVIVKF